MKSEKPYTPSAGQLETFVFHTEPPRDATVVRIAELADSSAMKRIAAAAFGKYLGRLTHPPIAIFLDYEEVAKAGNTYVLDVNRRVVGMVMCLAEASHLLVRNLAVLPEYQGLGLGKVLVDFSEAEARRRTLTEVRLWTREEMTDNIKYYERQGYSVTHKDVVDECTRVYLRKRLEIV